MSVLKLGVPKGSLQESTIRLFARAGYKITVAVELGVTSYYENRTMYFDPQKREILKTVPPRKHQLKF